MAQHFNGMVYGELASDRLWHFFGVGWGGGVEHLGGGGSGEDCDQEGAGILMYMYPCQLTTYDICPIHNSHPER